MNATILTVVTSSGIATLVTLTVTQLIEVWKRSRTATFGAFRVANAIEDYICALDRYVRHLPVAALSHPFPVFPGYPDDIDWSQIDHLVLDRSLAVPGDAEHWVKFVGEWVAEADPKVEQLGQNAANLFRDALRQLALDVRSCHQLPAKDWGLRPNGFAIPSR